jgi:hypothetical protein
MYFPRELFIDFYQKVQIFDHPFESWRWKPLGPRSTSSQREDWYGNVSAMNQNLGVAAIDLGMPPDAVRAFFADASRAYYRHIVQNVETNPLIGEPDRATESFFGFGIARDTASAKAFAEIYSRTAAGMSEGNPKLTRNALHWGVANVLVCHAKGSSLEEAANRLKKLPASKTLGAKVGAIMESLRELALECATGKPEPTRQLRKLAEANAAIWRYDDIGTFEAYLCQWGLALACLARDRGWKMPDEDPHPSMPLSLLRLKPIKIDLSNDKFSPPGADMKKRIAAARKEMLALLYPKKSGKKKQ